jgi:hypothetical protein
MMWPHESHSIQRTSLSAIKVLSSTEPQSGQFLSKQITERKTEEKVAGKFPPPVQAVKEMQHPPLVWLPLQTNPVVKRKISHTNSILLLSNKNSFKKEKRLPGQT